MPSYTCISERKKEQMSLGAGWWVVNLTAWRGQAEKLGLAGPAQCWHTLPLTGNSQAAAQLCRLALALAPGPPASLPGAFLPDPGQSPGSPCFLVNTRAWPRTHLV